MSVNAVHFIQCTQFKIDGLLSKNHVTWFCTYRKSCFWGFFSFNRHFYFTLFRALLSVSALCTNMDPKYSFFPAICLGHTLTFCFLG